MGWMDQERALQLPRARQLVTELLRPAVFAESLPLTITAYHVPGEPVTAREASRGHVRAVLGRRGMGATVGHDMVSHARRRPRSVGGSASFHGSSSAAAAVSASAPRA